MAATLKYSPSTTFDESEILLPSQPIEESMITGGLIASNWGEGDKVIDLYTVKDLENNAGFPNDYNSKDWFNLRDLLIGGYQLKMVRAIPTNAHNASLKLKGISHLSSTTAWYDGSTVLDLEDVGDFYNSDVAEYQLDQSFTTTSKLQIIHKYVTTKETLAVAVCSNANHYEQPIFDEEIEVIQSNGWYQEPNSPVEYEKYKIARNTMTITDTDSSANTITVTGDYSSIVATTELYILATGLDETESYLPVTSATYDSATNTTVIVVSAISQNDKTGTASYLTGTNWKTLTTLLDDDVAIYSTSTSTWTKLELTTNQRYYFSDLGQVWYWSGSAWTRDPNANYLPVDTDRDGKNEYAVKNIFASNLYNSDNSLKSFKDIYKENLNFEYRYDANDNINSDDCLVFVFQMNEKDNIWYLKEQHYGSYLITSRDENNKPNNIERVILEDSNLIYAKIGEVNEYVISDIGESSTIDVASDLRDIQAGDKLPYEGVIVDGEVRDVAGTFTVVSASYSSPTTTITVAEDTSAMTRDAGSKISDTYAGRVSTNRNIYSDPYHVSYDIANKDASDGFPLSYLIVYDTAPVNSSSATITDYSDLTATDKNSSADTFLDRDNVDVDLLISFETEDEFGNHKQDKMGSIAATRTDCYAIVAPMDETLFLGYTKEEIMVHLIEQFGNQRDSLYTGTFTKFGKYSGCDSCTMKYIEDTYNNKYRWVSVAGDIARMTIESDYDSTRGVWTPIANENGELTNGIKYSYIPTEAQREELNKHSINTVFKNGKIQYPRVFSNYTSYRSTQANSLFKIRSVRMMLNKIENNMRDNIFPLYFKFKEDKNYKRIKDATDSFLNKILVGGGLYSFQVLFPEVPNEPSDTMTIYLKLGVTGILQKFNVKVEMTEQGVNIIEEV